MTKQSLNGTDVGAVSKEISSVSVTEGVGGNRFYYSGGASIGVHDSLNGASGERGSDGVGRILGTVVADKEKFGEVGAFFEIVGEGDEGGGGEKN